MEIRGAGVIDCFFCEGRLKNRECELSALGLEIGGVTIFIPPPPGVESLQVAIQHRIVQSRAPYTEPGPLAKVVHFTRVRTPENQCNRTLPQKTSENMRLLQSLLIIQNCKT